jgi:8-oxo-dGTP pyrophosphatase MutT (NUDIX family)
MLRFIYAAGGLIWREGESEREILLVNRTKYDDWSLPKGKLDEGEGWAAAARREVREETGLDVELFSFAGVTTYFLKADPKVVLYWNMRVVGEAKDIRVNPKEIKGMRWFSVKNALEQLSHPVDYGLLHQNEDLNYRLR